MTHPIEIQGLRHQYGRGDHPAVDGLDLFVREGESVGLLGPNGAGKTTTLHTVLGLLAPTSGTVRVFGRSPLTDRAWVMARLNFASVDVDLPSNLRVQEALSIFARLYRVPRPGPRIDELLGLLEIPAQRRQLIGTLSAGQQMRVKLCKALLNRPSLLVLDEPTLSLDPYMAQHVRTLLRRIQHDQGISILHTTHNMREAETFCDRIVFLNRGRKLAEGAPGDVLARFGSRSLEEMFIRIATGGDLWASDNPGSP